MKSWIGMTENMMTSSNKNIFRGAGCVRGIHRSPVNSPHKGQWRGAMFFICVWTNDWLNNRDAGDLRRDRAHYDVTVMIQRNETNEPNHTNFAISHNTRPKRLCFPPKNLQHKFYTSEGRNHRNTTIFTRNKAFGSLETFSNGTDFILLSICHSLLWFYHHGMSMSDWFVWEPTQVITFDTIWYTNNTHHKR